MNSVSCGKNLKGYDKMNREAFIQYLENLIDALEMLKDQLEEDIPPAKADAVMYIDEKPLLDYLNCIIDFE